MLLNCGVRQDSWQSLGLQGDPTSPSKRKSVLTIHWKDWCWSWNSNTLATWCKELAHLKTSWWKIEGRRRRGQQRMRWLDGITDLTDKREQALGVGDGQRRLVCCSPWDCKESDTTEQLIWLICSNMDDVSHKYKVEKKKTKHKYCMIPLTCSSETGKNYFIELEVKIVCILGEDKEGSDWERVLKITASNFLESR